MSINLSVTEGAEDAARHAFTTFAVRITQMLEPSVDGIGDLPCNVMASARLVVTFQSSFWATFTLVADELLCTNASKTALRSYTSPSMAAFSFGHSGPKRSYIPD